MVIQPPATKTDANAGTTSRLLDLPTFMREKKIRTDESATPAAGMRRVENSGSDDLDDLDIPTFLRKQMD